MARGRERYSGEEANRSAHAGLRCYIMFISFSSMCIGLMFTGWGGQRMMDNRGCIAPPDTHYEGHRQYYMRDCAVDMLGFAELDYIDVATRAQCQDRCDENLQCNSIHWKDRYQVGDKNVQVGQCILRAACVDMEGGGCWTTPNWENWTTVFSPCVNASGQMVRANITTPAPVVTEAPGESNSYDIYALTFSTGIMLMLIGLCGAFFVCWDWTILLLAFCTLSGMCFAMLFLASFYCFIFTRDAVAVIEELVQCNQGTRTLSFLFLKRASKSIPTLGAFLMLKSFMLAFACIVAPRTMGVLEFVCRLLNIFNYITAAYGAGIICVGIFAIATPEHHMVKTAAETTHPWFVNCLPVAGLIILALSILADCAVRQRSIMLLRAHFLLTPICLTGMIIGAAVSVGYPDGWSRHHVLAMANLVTLLLVLMLGSTAGSIYIHNMLRTMGVSRFKEMLDGMDSLIGDLEFSLGDRSGRGKRHQTSTRRPARASRGRKKGRRGQAPDVTLELEDVGPKQYRAHMSSKDFFSPKFDDNDLRV